MTYRVLFDVLAPMNQPSEDFPTLNAAESRIRQRFPQAVRADKWMPSPSPDFAIRPIFVDPDAKLRTPPPAMGSGQVFMPPPEDLAAAVLEFYDDE